MCGIAGYVGSSLISKKRISETLGLMKNRGPNNSSVLHKKIKNKNIFFLHTRLSILDLKKRSNQPFIYNEKILIFNGEIYNFIELKKLIQKKGYTFTTKSDTEVLIKGYDCYGAKIFDRLEGMWSLAIYDLKKNKLLLSRDRFGEKPLFFSKDKTGIYFGSETKFIEKLNKEKYLIDINKCKKYLLYGYNSVFLDDRTFYNNINLLNPSKNLIVKNNKLKKISYWKLNNIKEKKKFNFKKELTQLKKDIKNIIKIKLRSDVKVGFYLSGGVDSTMLVSTSQKILEKKISTFSIKNKKSSDYNENYNINFIKKKLNVKNYSLNVEKINFFKNLKELIVYYNSPVLTINSLAQNLLLKEIKRRNFKVIISGIGADEIFSGYYDHFLYHLKDLDKKNYRTNYNNWINKVKPITKNQKIINTEFKGKNFINFSRLNFVSTYYKKLIINPIIINKEKQKKKFNSFLKSALFYQIKENLYPALYQEDLNAMLNSIENRSPFLDKKLFEKIFSIPSQFFIQKGFAKFILRSLITNPSLKYIKNQRKKVGFNISINTISEVNKLRILRLINENKKILKNILNIKKLNRFINDIDFKNISTEDNKFIFRLISTVLFFRYKFNSRRN